MRKTTLTVALFSIFLSACSILDKKPCPPVTICPPAVECPPIPEPTPCPPPEPTPTPVPCPECPPVVVCPPEKVCPPIPVPTPCPPPVCPPEKICPPPVIAMPDDGVLLYKPDAKCPPYVTNILLPTQEKVDCLQREVAKAIKANIHSIQPSGFKLSPGNKSPCYSFYGIEYVNCIDKQFEKIPKVSYGVSAHYTKGSIGITPWEGCAAGISGDPIRVSLAEDWRKEPLVAWETANWYYWVPFDRLDLADGPMVSDAVSKAIAACSATSKTLSTVPVYTFENLVDVTPKKP